MFWATFEHRRPMVVKVALAISITGLAIFITLYYHYLQDPTFHQNAYAILTAIVLIRSMVLQELHIRPYFRGKALEDGRTAKSTMSIHEAEKEQLRRDERDRLILKRMWTLVATGLGVFLSGFAIWSLDNNYCGRIRAWRHIVGLPLGVLSEGHGYGQERVLGWHMRIWLTVFDRWWHLLTGLGAYFYIV